MPPLAATALAGPGSHGTGHVAGLAAGRGRNRRPGARAWLIAAALLGLGAPAYANGNTCMFQAKGLAMSFGTLDPSSGATVTVPVAAATLNANKAGDCAPGQAMVISGDNGQNFSGSRRMRGGAGTDYIAYTLSLPASIGNGPGNGSYATFTFNGTVVGSAYEGASAGSYADTVLITVTP